MASYKTPLPAAVEEYLTLVESGSPRCCPEQIALAQYVRRVFETEALIFEAERFERYCSLSRYFTFELFPWERFLLALWLCTYSAPGRPRWRTLFCLIGRGSGKDGLIGFLSFCAASPYNPVPSYDVDICANDEEQAMRPVRDVLDVLETPAQEAKLKRYYYHTKELIQGRKNRGVIKGRTNNPKHRDGMRSGMIVFNEVHAFENYDNIAVFTGGLGKKPEPRVGIFTSDGNVSDGPLDSYVETSNGILFNGEDDDGFLPFICRLPSEDLVHDQANWYMANPSLQYRPELLTETADEYRQWMRNPEQMSEFLTKRMGIRKTYKEITVTDYDKVKATNKPLPDLSGWSCVIGLDYAELSDWASVNLHFRRGEQRYDISHSWLCLQSKTLHRVKAPWREWADAGYLTVVDDVTISPDLLAAYIMDAAKKYNVKKLALDHFRYTLIKESLQRIGFDAENKDRMKLVRPSDIMQIEPVIQTCFDRELFFWGDNPPLRWAVNNTKRVRSSAKVKVDTGNFVYAKIDAKARKTDPFMALVASMCVEAALGSGAPVQPPKLGAILLRI